MLQIMSPLKKKRIENGFADGLTSGLIFKVFSERNFIFEISISYPPNGGRKLPAGWFIRITYK